MCALGQSGLGCFVLGHRGALHMDCTMGRLRGLTQSCRVPWSNVLLEWKDVLLSPTKQLALCLGYVDVGC